MTWGGLLHLSEEPPADTNLAPAWSRELRQIQHLVRGVSFPVAAVDDDVPFAYALQPLVDVCWTRLETASATAGLTASARADVRRALLRRLSDVAVGPLGEHFAGDRTLADVALAHIADGKAAGSDTAAYMRFCQDQVESGYDAILAEFPVLGRLLATIVVHWSGAFSEFLERLRKTGQRWRAPLGSRATPQSPRSRAG